VTFPRTASPGSDAGSLERTTVTRPERKDGNLIVRRFRRKVVTLAAWPEAQRPAPSALVLTIPTRGASSGVVPDPHRG